MSSWFRHLDVQYNFTRNYGFWGNNRRYQSEFYYPDNYNSFNDWIKSIKDKKFKQGSISMIPNDIFKIIFYHLIRGSTCSNFICGSFRDNNKNDCIRVLCRCSRVNREWRDYFSQNEIWRNVFIYHRISVVYYKRIQKLAKEKDTGYSEESHKDIHQKCHMIIKNKTKDITFDIYWVKNKDNKYSYWACLLPGEVFNCLSFSGHKWFCIPSKKWLFMNPRVDVGSTWNIDVYKLESYTIDKVTKLGYVKRIQEPDKNKYFPIKGVDREFPSFQHRIMQLVLSKDDIQYLKNKNHDDKGKNIQRMKYFEEQIRSIKQSIHNNEKKEKEYTYILKIIKK